MYGSPDAPGSPHPSASLPAPRRVEGRVFHPAGALNARTGSHPALLAHEMTMATIGTFTASDNGYTGLIKTLTLNIKAKFAASEKENDKAPDYRIFAGSTEFGAAWKKTARDSDREYLSVKLDDPSFPAPIYASLVKVEGDEDFTLIWSRRSGD